MFGKLMCFSIFESQRVGQR